MSTYTVWIETPGEPLTTQQVEATSERAAFRKASADLKAGSFIRGVVEEEPAS